MRYLSLFSGIEAASVAWEPLGWEPVAFCEIDAFPSAVLAYHYPNVPNLGDITKVNWDDFKDKYGAVDLIVGGSPCQSFSVAGGREGLDGESRLMYEYIRAVSEVRPTWFLWENVPGVFSTDAGRAFGILLDAMEELGYGLAWATLDAQFFGVAQRRRRVFLVGYLGAGGGSAAVLFDAESVRGNTQTSKEKREELTRTASVSAYGFKSGQGARAKGIGYEQEQCPTLACDHNTAVLAFNDGQITSPQNGNIPQFGDACHTLAAGDRPPCIAIQGDGSTSLNIQGDGYKQDGTSYTLNCTDRHSVICMADDTSNAAIDNDLSGTLKVGGGSPILVAPCVLETTRGYVQTMQQRS